MLDETEVTEKWRSVIFAAASKNCTVRVWRDADKTPWIFQNRRHSAELRKSPALKGRDYENV